MTESNGKPASPRLDGIVNEARLAAAIAVVATLKDPEMLVMALAPAVIPWTQHSLQEQFGELSHDEQRAASEAARLETTGWCKQVLESMDAHMPAVLAAKEAELPQGIYDLEMPDA